MHVATEGNLRFVLRPGKKMGKGFEAEIYKRDSRAKQPWLSGHFASKAQAIDWMARYRTTEDQVA
jgi:hypothetical protein